jgi:putative PIN family toxin of toxin-antitoxin system
MRVVVDTNVLVSALLSPHGPPAQVLRLLLQGNAVALYDDRILAEYREVLSRPRFAFAAEDVRLVLEEIEGGGETVFAKPLAIELPDPDDLPFLEVAVAGGADALVTGNNRHFRPLRGKHRVEIVSPNGLVERVARS